jgi:hypothetical protein
MYHPLPKLGDAAMKQQINADRLDNLAEEYSTHADDCHYMAERAVSPFKEDWVRLATSWTSLAEEAKARSRPS